MWQPYVGTINYKKKRYGFITPDDGGNDVYANVKKCPELGATQKGERVYYNARWNERKGTYTATSLALVPFSEAPEGTEVVRVIPDSKRFRTSFQSSTRQTQLDHIFF